MPQTLVEPPAPLTRTAYHEAGHAVATLALGLEVEHVTVKPDEEEGYLGLARRADDGFAPALPREDEDSEDHTRRLEAEIVSTMAGMAAETVFFGGYNPALVGRDTDTLVDLLLGLGPDTGEASHWERYWERTVALLEEPGNRAAVEWVAHALLEAPDGNLSGREVAEVFGRAAVSAARR